MAKEAKTSQPPKGTKANWLKTTIITAIIASVLAVIANSAFWVNRYIFDADNFTSVATTSLTSESSRRAVAQEIVNRALANYPTVRGIVDNAAVNVISGVLGSDQFSNILTKSINKLHVVVTSNNQESVVINLEGPKELLTRVVDVVGDYRQVDVDPSNIPSEIVLVNKDNIPNFYKYGVIFLWLGPIALLGALALFGIPYYKWHENYKNIMITQGVALLGISLLALTLGPLFRPPLLSKVTSSDARVVIGNLYDAFIATFNNQTKVLIMVGLLAIAVGAFMMLAPKFIKQVSKIKAKA